MASPAGVLKHRDLFSNWVFAFAVALSKHDGFIKYQFVLTSVKTRIMKIVEKSLRGRENTPLVSHLLKRLLSLPSQESSFTTGVDSKARFTGSNHSRYLSVRGVLTTCRGTTIVGFALQLLQ